MRGVLGFLIVLISFPAVKAQSWCPPGATWNYAIQALMTDGYIVRTYVGDTVVDGWIAQKIHEQGEQILHWLDDTLQIDNIQLTSVQDSIVFLRNENNGIPAWDTLFRFDAVIGDRWFPPGADSVCLNGTAGMLEVIDTGSIVIYGMPLRTWELAYLDEFGDPFWTGVEVIERLGYLNGLTILPGACIIIEYNELLQCYDDAEIHYGWMHECGLVSIPETNAREDWIYPNPGTDHLTLELPPGASAIEILDATGRRVLSQRSVTPIATVTTGSLAQGIYLVSVDGTRTARWVKQ